MTTLMRNLLKLASAGALAAVSLGCSANFDAKQESLIAPASLSQFDVNLHPANKLVCDPFGDGQSPQINGGLVAQLFYLKPGGQQRFTRVQDYVDQAQKSGQKLFFSQLNVPTRLFNLGFTTETGDVVRDDDQNMLFEYFALKFTSVFKLAADQEEGLYELAILSDDGAVLKMRDSEGIYKTMVDNDGDHPTRLGCATEYVDMRRDTEKVIDIAYYQGPRFHISLIVLMRKVTPVEGGVLPRDPACGVTGNDTWFNSNKQSEPQQAYKDLLARGWKPLTKDNYGLPNTAMFNPCVAGTPPVVSNFRMVEATSSSLRLEWETNIPATSQVGYIQNGASESQLTTADNQLRTTHSVLVSGLSALTTYRVQAISISADYGRGFSPQLTVTTED